MTIKKKKFGKALFKTSKPLREKREKFNRRKVKDIVRERENKCFLYALSYMHLYFCTS